MKNILLDKNGHCKIIESSNTRDLKKAREDYEKRDIKIPLSSAEYTAPEIYFDKFDYTIDFWSLGVLAFKMLTGNYPFQTRMNILNETLNLESITSSEEAKDFVNDLLNKNPDQRLGSINNSQNIKNHSFFSDIDWNLLENGGLEPPFKPIEVIIIIFCPIYLSTFQLLGRKHSRLKSRIETIIFYKYFYLKEFNSATKKKNKCQYY